jgi:hypothetical protein
MSENDAPVGAADSATGRVEIGPHTWFAGGHRNKDDDIREAYADALRRDVLKGYVTIIMRFDPNTGELEDKLFNAAELRPAIDDIAAGALITNSKLQLAFEKIVGERATVVDYDKTNDEAAKRRKYPNRKEYLTDCLTVAKLLFGTLPKAVQANDAVKAIEEELRRYHARGNPLPIGVRRYLVSAAAEVNGPLPRFGDGVADELRSRLPFVFDPTDVSSTMKILYKLKQDNKGGPLAIKKLDDATKAKVAEQARINLKGKAKKAADEAGVTLVDMARGARGDAT